MFYFILLQHSFYFIIYFTAHETTLYVILVHRQIKSEFTLSRIEHIRNYTCPAVTAPDKEGAGVL